MKLKKDELAYIKGLKKGLLHIKPAPDTLQFIEEQKAFNQKINLALFGDNKEIKGMVHDVNKLTEVFTSGHTIFKFSAWLIAGLGTLGGLYLIGVQVVKTFMKPE